MNKSIRIDQLLVQLGYAGSRERAKILIANGDVRAGGKVIKKPAETVNENVQIEVSAKDIKWVSRAGLKLEKALEEWKVDVIGKVCLDIGASTGGFTEVLLYNGAKKVYALDVGHDQLASKLRLDNRVIVMEGRNIREASVAWFKENIDIITVDVSFISLKYIFPKITELLDKSGKAIVLVKPQFEVGKENIKKGIVRSTDLHLKVIEDTRKSAESYFLRSIDVKDSPIIGTDGNKEYLMLLDKIY